MGSWSSRKLHGSRASSRGEWKSERDVDGWKIERREKRGKVEFRLLDDHGHLQAKGEDARALEAKARLRMRTHFQRVENDDGLDEDPENTNLLFCRVARVLENDAPDWILLTGDVTDDGVGYELVLAKLQKWVSRGRLLAVPGNHDIYDSPRLAVPGHMRKKREEKRAEWSKFAAKLNLPGQGSWVRKLDESVIVGGLDSCHPPRVPFSASGKIQDRDLDVLEDELRGQRGTRLVMLHHHVVNPPMKAVGRAPIQLGLRLRNADQVYERLRKLEVSMVLNGHRHLGYRFHPTHAPMIVSSPSTTLGCASGAPRPYYWRIEISDGNVAVKERPI
jgi:3',5'-cyclic AMP phosphodiesterase CpdA